MTRAFSFFKNPNPVLPTDARQLSVALTASIRQTRGLVGHQEGCQPRTPRTPRLFHGESAPKTASVLLYFHFFTLGSQELRPLYNPRPYGPLVCLPLFCLFPQPHFCMGQTLCYVGQNASFLAGKRKRLVFVANLFPFFGVTSGLLFGGFWGILPSRRHSTVGYRYWAAYLKDVMMSGCHLWAGIIPARGFPGITKLSHGWT